MTGIMSRWYRNRWQAGLDIERRFWEKWVDSEGMEWKDDFLKRLDPLFSSALLKLYRRSLLQTIH